MSEWKFAGTFQYTFQLPLSGSLSRSEIKVVEIDLNPFQLPLSGSHHVFQTAGDDEDEEDDFQLPLSGSPNPIPGFSGSPRLPAAAPLRTSVFSGHYLKI